MTVFAANCMESWNANMLEEQLFKWRIKWQVVWKSEFLRTTYVPVHIKLTTSVADPDPWSGAFVTPGSGSGMNSPDHISESLETIFGVKILKFFDADPRSGIKIPDPQSLLTTPFSVLSVP
jgi:hypothetical protein